MHDDGVMRKTPRQARGQQRVETIMSAAVELFAEVGYEAATTNEIARRAHTSIGSLYQFFPNKEAILTALIASFREGVQALFDEVFSTPHSTRETLASAFEHLMDRLVTIYVHEPKFRVVFYGFSTSPDFQGAGSSLYEEILARLNTVLASGIPTIDETARSRAALAMLVTTKAMLPYTVTAEGIDAGMAAELKRMIRAYVGAL
jgi:AcrR family transcriptional regulator